MALDSRARGGGGYVTISFRGNDDFCSGVPHAGVAEGWCYTHL